MLFNRRLALSAAVMSLAFISIILVQPVNAFGTDTHYYLTYYIACRSGFTAEEAQIIASADYCIDQGGTASGFMFLRNNPDWHALSSSHTFSSEREAYLWQRALAILNSTSPADRDAALIAFGQLLHYSQDRISHQGFILAEVWGHFYVGHKTDWLAYRQNASGVMAEKTSSYMLQFAASYKGTAIFQQNYSDFVNELVSANPDPMFWHDPDSNASRIVVEDALGSGILPPIIYTYDARGDLIQPNTYSENFLIAYFAVLFEQLLPW